MSPPRFGILILNMNGARWLPDLYDDLRRDGYAGKRVYLVDNASTDDSLKLTRERYPEVCLVRLPRNMGYAMAYNAACAVALADDCEWLVWQNNDTRVLPGWLDRMAEAADTDPRIGVMGPVFRDWTGDGPNLFMRRRHPDVVPFMEDPSGPPVDVDWVEGSACAVRRECLRETGPLDPELFMYWEETDFCRRARHRGWRVVLVPGSVVRHFGGGPAASGAAPRVDLLKTRNQYVWTLCDPGRSLTGNALSVARLFLVNCKAAVLGPRPLVTAWRHACIFGRFLVGLPGWCRKWSRDRRHGQPEPFRAGQALSPGEMTVEPGGR